MRSFVCTMSETMLLRHITIAIDKRHSICPKNPAAPTSLLDLITPELIRKNDLTSQIAEHKAQNPTSNTIVDYVKVLRDNSLCAREVIQQPQRSTQHKPSTFGKHNLRKTTISMTEITNPKHDDVLYLTMTIKMISKNKKTIHQDGSDEDDETYHLSRNSPMLIPFST